MTSEGVPVPTWLTASVFGVLSLAGAGFCAYQLLVGGRWGQRTHAQRLLAVGGIGLFGARDRRAGCSWAGGTSSCLPGSSPPPASPSAESVNHLPGASTTAAPRTSAVVSDSGDLPRPIATRRAIYGFSCTRSHSVPRMAAPGKRPTGRPSKGPRATLVGRVHPDVSVAVRAAAAAQGFSLTDYLEAILAGAHGLPQYIPAGARHQQDRLPLPKSA